jgi:hypothetical protein
MQWHLRAFRAGIANSDRVISESSVLRQPKMAEKKRAARFQNGGIEETRIGEDNRPIRFD